MVGVGVWAIGAVAIVTLGVAALVMFLDFGQRVHRAFALFLVLRAMMDGMLVFALEDGLGYRLRMYWLIAVPFAALHFCLAYRRRHGQRNERRPAWVAPMAILAVALLFEGLYLADHDLFAGPPDYGPFYSFQAIRFLSYAAVAWVFAAEFRRTTRASGRRALLLASLGFAMTPLFVCTFLLADDLRSSSLTWSLPAVYYAASLVLLGDGFRRLFGGTTGKSRAFTLASHSIALGMAVLNVAANAFTDFGEQMLQALTAVSALAVPVCITYALVKHRLFDIEVRLRFAIRGTTLAGLFLAVFFVVNKVTENVVASQFENKGVGIYVGGAVAGLLLFAISPLQKLADRIAAKAVPQVPGGLPTTDREQIYREQLEIAWRDGRLTAKERLLFTRLQQRLGLAAEQASRLETEVLQAMAVPPGKRKRASPA